MKLIPLPNGPFKKWPFFTPDEIEKAALADLKQCGLLPSAPREIDVAALAKGLFSFDITYAEIGEDILGFISFGPRGPKKITISERLADLEAGITADQRRRSTAGHECGHGRLHAGPFIELAQAREQEIFGEFVRDAKLQPLRACRSHDIRDADSAMAPSMQDWERMGEWQANRYMAAVLAPARLVQAAVGSLLRTGGPILSLDRKERDALAPEIAATFNVSRQLATIRLAELFTAAGP